MKEGWFTDKRLDQFIKATRPPEYEKARAVINLAGCGFQTNNQPQEKISRPIEIPVFRSMNGFVFTSYHC